MGFRHAGVPDTRPLSVNKHQSPANTASCWRHRGSTAWAAWKARDGLKGLGSKDIEDILDLQIREERAPKIGLVFVSMALVAFGLVIGVVLRQALNVVLELEGSRRQLITDTCMYGGSAFALVAALLVDRRG